MSINSVKRLAAALIIACAVMDLAPRHGPPEFRYSGSDPVSSVWNLGWPVALAIYDSRSGFHVGPFCYAVVPFQVAIVSAIAALSLWHRRNWRSRLSGRGVKNAETAET